MNNLSAFFAQNVDSEAIEEKTVEEMVEEVKRLINEGDAEWNYAYYALHELHILPDQIAKMSRKQRAALYAMIDLRLERFRNKVPVNQNHQVNGEENE